MTEIKIINTTPEELKSFIDKSVKDAFAGSNPRKSPTRIKPYPKKEVMEKFGVSAPTLDRWHRKGILTKHKTDRLVYYNPDDVHELFESKNV